MISFYALGILAAIISGLIFKNTVSRKLSDSFVMELPPYRIPTLKGALIHMWEQGSLFLKKAGTIIFFGVILIWILSSVPSSAGYATQTTVIGRIGTFISPIFAPLGFGQWQSAVALLTGIAGKELIVSTFGTVGGIEGIFTPASAYSFCIFVLLYMPCLAAIAVMRKETGTWRWPLFTIVYTTIFAWVASFASYLILSMIL